MPKLQWLFSILVLMCFLPRCAVAEPEPVYCWQDGHAYAAPDFATYFPDSAPGAAALSRLWNSPDREDQNAEQVLSTVRGGLRQYKGGRAAVLRWVGRRYIENHEPQNLDAIEIMYHAIDLSAQGTEDTAMRGAAIRFGLSVVRPMGTNLLRALTELSLESESPDELSRIAWAMEAQRDDALRLLESYRTDKDERTRQKAEVVRRLWNRELKAYDWVREIRNAQARAYYGERADSISRILRFGDSGERARTLELMLENGVLAILPDGELEGLSRCAADSDPAVRVLATRAVGERWILHASVSAPDAVELLLRSSKDDTKAVQYAAVYYGLSAISPKDDAVLTRLLEIAAAHPEPDLMARIEWGITAEQPRLRTMLNSWIRAPDPARAQAGRFLYGVLVK